LDVRSDANGQPSFIEVNPLPGLQPNHSDLPLLCSFRGISYTDLIGAIVHSAHRRITSQAAAA
jgi:D-alanine-D-alanine ligase